MSKTTFASLRTWLLDNLLLVITFSGVFIGVLTGILLKPMELDKVTISYVAYPGELFMRLLKLMILPLIIASLITGKRRPALSTLPTASHLSSNQSSGNFLCFSLLLPKLFH